MCCGPAWRSDGGAEIGGRSNPLPRPTRSSRIAWSSPRVCDFDFADSIWDYDGRHFRPANAVREALLVARHRGLCCLRRAGGCAGPVPHSPVTPLRLCRPRCPYSPVTSLQAHLPPCSATGPGAASRCSSMPRRGPRGVASATLGCRHASPPCSGREGGRVRTRPHPRRLRPSRRAVSGALGHCRAVVPGERWDGERPRCRIRPPRRTTAPRSVARSMPHLTRAPQHQRTRPSPERIGVLDRELISSNVESFLQNG